MLHYARTLVGKPFSNVGMARSIIFPRRSDEQSFFCAGACLCIRNIYYLFMTFVHYVHDCLVRRACSMHSKERRVNVRLNTLLISMMQN